MRTIIAKFKSTCAETGREIRKGEQCIYDVRRKKVYHLNSDTAMRHNEPAGGIDTAEQEAYFDNFCFYNNL